MNDDSSFGQLPDLLLLRTWWRYAGSDTWLGAIYHWFNIFEGCAWLVISVLIMRRYFKHRVGSVEQWYAFAFFTFALTDFREAWVQQSWLLWIKLVNLILLFMLRRHVIRRFYPDARLY